MDPTNQPNPESGNKVMLIFLLILSVLIVILLLLMMTNVWPVCGEVSQKPGYGGGKAFGVCQTVECDGETCVVETVTGCCGNGICEGGEAPSECPIDCAGGGEVTTTTNAEGDTYNEFNIGDELVCEPNSGESDGAICVCEENDCGDGVDNDDDGLIDCLDPDCDCLPEDCSPCEDCPPCDGCEDECGQYPDCRGSCVTPSGVYGECGIGDDECCHCYPPEQYDCTDMDTAYCRQGTCPPGEVCEYTIGECGCVQEDGGCEDECGQYPDCMGSCVMPDGVYGQCGIGDDECCHCYPPDQYDCAQTDSAYCERGTCPPGEVCEYTIGECGCVPEQGDDECNNDQFPTCGGYCSVGFHCGAIVTGMCGCIPDEEDDCGDQADNDGDGYTDCEDTDCEDAVECGGDDCAQMDTAYCGQGVCPPGEVCEYVPGANCQCVEEGGGETCSDMYPFSCGQGECDPGKKCVALDSITCECIWENDDSCDHISDTAYCSIGECSGDQVCEVVGSDCECVTSCEDISDVKMCGTGWCPGSQVCMERGNGCACGNPVT